MILVGRFLYGAGNGSFTVLINKYLNEVAPLEMKGPIGLFFQLLLTSGIVLSNIAGLPFVTPDYKTDFPLPKESTSTTIYCNALKLQFFDRKFGEIEGANEKFFRFTYWKIVFGIPIVFSVLQMLLMQFFFNHESPKYLKQKGRVADLNLLMGKIYSSDQVAKRIDAIDTNEGSKQVTLKEALTDGRYKNATYIGILLMIAQQLSGINIINSYGTQIFRDVIEGFGNWIQVIIGLCNFLPTIPAYFLIKYVGRKTLLWTFTFAIAISLVAGGISMLLHEKQPDDNTASVLSLAFLILYTILFCLA